MFRQGKDGISSRDFGPSLFIAFNSDLCYYSSRAVPFGQRFFETR